MWFRRDLRTQDHPALGAAAAAAGDGRVIPVFVLDPVLWRAGSDVRRAYLTRSLASLKASLDGALVILDGDPVDAIPALVARHGVTSVHVTADYGRYGRERDRAVEAALGSTPFVRTGSVHVIAPGTIRKDDGTPYRVFTPFSKAWLRHGWHAPAPDVTASWWQPEPGVELPVVDPGLDLPAAGEQAAWAQWARFRERGAATYADDRNRPDLDTSSRMSTALKWGEVHPRSLLAELTDADEAWQRQLCWRDFYGDVLFHQPRSVNRSLDARFDHPDLWDDGPDADARFDAWAQGRTGFPLVDAGMRQLRAEGWMHNRVRMVVASFLVKDLHLPWQRGAREFNRWLTDADTANNAHGWQWTAGCGTDASPFYRVFNPIGQGQKFDPDGDYVRRYVPELRHLPGATVHEPWKVIDGLAHGYPEPIVDHAAERLEALAMLERMKQLPKNAPA